MEKLKNVMLWLVMSNIGRLVLGASLFLIGYVPLNWVDSDTLFGSILYYIGCAGVLILLGMTLVGIAFAWVINPIKSYLDSKKDKK